MKTHKKELLKPWWNDNIDYLPLGAKWRGRWHKRQVKRMIREIDERALDIEVAEKVFGHKVEIQEMFESSDEGGDYYYPELMYRIKHPENPGAIEEFGCEPFWYEEIKLPNYSTDIKDAWTVVEKFPVMTLNFQQYCHTSERYYVRFDNYSTAEINDNSATKAICLGALKIMKLNEHI